MRRRSRRPPEGEFLAEVLDLAEDGRGVARLDGKVVFIADSLPGERVRFRYVDTGRAADEGQTVAVEVASPDRVEPGCAHFGLCGGCALQHLAPEAQIRFKQKQMLDALARIGQVTPEDVAPPITGPVWGYRRRARIGVKKVPKKGGVLVGFRERRSHFLAQLQACPVLDPRVGERLRVLADAIGVQRRLTLLDISHRHLGVCPARFGAVQAHAAPEHRLAGCNPMHPRRTAPPHRLAASTTYGCRRMASTTDW